MEFAQVLRRFLVEEKLTQEKFAQRVGVKQSQVSGWLHGHWKPGYDLLQKICLAYPEIPAQFWLGLTDEY